MVDIAGGGLQGGDGPAASDETDETAAAFSPKTFVTDKDITPGMKTADIMIIQHIH